jgi:hypothetical protein
MEYRLGDVIDDHCIKCRRLTNHSVVSIVNDEVAKVRCRSCYHEHMYLHEQAPPSRKDLKKAEALAALQAEGSAAANTPEAAAVPVPPPVEQGDEPEDAASATATSKSRSRKA